MNNGVIGVPELPKGWLWVTLKEIGANDKNAIVDGPFGSNLKVSDYIEDDTGIPVLTTKNLEYGYDKKNLRYISDEKFEQLRRSEVRSGDILVAKIGSCGKTGVYPNNMPSAMIPANLLKMTVNSWIERMYVYYFLNSPVFRGELEEITTATAQPAFNVSKFRSLAFPLCPYTEQQRIVAKIEELFTRLDAGVEALKTIKAQLRRYRQSVLRDAFRGKLTQQWREALQHELEPTSVLLERIKKERRKTAKAKYKELPPLDISTLPELPEGWIWIRLGDILEVIRGASPRPKGDPRYFGGTIPWIMISDISKEKGKYISATRDMVTEEGARRSRYLKKGTLILSNSGTVCIPKILAVDGCIHDGFVAFPDITNQIEIMYLYHCFDYIRPEVTQENRQGVTQVNLNTEIVRNIVIPFPTRVEQDKIVEEVERHFSVTDQIEKTVDHSLKQAERLHHSILKRAFEGKLVPQDPNDESAEKLLEKIKAERTKRLAEAKATSTSKKKTTTEQRRLV